jgi:hypothetical protein
MNLEERLKLVTEAEAMILVDNDEKVCFTELAHIAYACPIFKSTKSDPLKVEASYLNVYLNAEVIEFLTPKELEKRPIFNKEKNKNMEAYVVTVKNAINKQLVRFKIQRISNTFQYSSFLNACIINKKLQPLIYATPHIGLMYFGRFIEMGEIAVLFGLDESKLQDEVYGFQAIEDVGTKSAKTYIKEWIALIHENKTSTALKHKFDTFLRSFLFRIIYTLHCILLRFPSFRHNDLHLDNIIMSMNETNEVSTYETENDMSFEISNEFSFPRIIDFGWSSLIGVKEIGLNMKTNHYVDLNKMFNHLFLLFEKQSDVLHPQVWKFIQSVVPEAYRVGVHKSKNMASELQMSIWSPHSEYAITKEKTWILSSSSTKGRALPNFTNPGQLLLDPVFSVLRTVKRTGIIFSSLKALEID